MEAEVLADLYGIAFDLEEAARFCDLALRHGIAYQLEKDVVEALVIAATIKYARCFKSGVRARLDIGDMPEVPIGDVLLHEYVIALRDKFIAHSVNHFEETYVTAAARETDGKRMPIASLNPGQHRLLLSASDARSLAELIAEVKRSVDALIEAEERKLLAHINALPIDAIHSGDLHSPSTMDFATVWRARKRKRQPKSPKS